MPESSDPIQTQEFLAGVDYPAHRNTLVAAAEKSGADEDVMRALRGLPDRTYGQPTEVSQAISGGGPGADAPGDDPEPDDDERTGERFDAG